MKKFKIGIIGATGFTGSELVRILTHHPQVEITVITSESRKGEKFSDVHPFFHGLANQTLDSADNVEPYDLDLAFLALPHGVSMDYVARWKDQNFKIVDLSGDFRLRTPQVYEEWYPKAHSFTEGFDDAVYGLPELWLKNIQQSHLVANPGCYPTASILAMAPLMKSAIAAPGQVIIDAKSGVTGAGVKASATTHFSNVNDNFKAYGIKTHRHSIEIQEQLENLSSSDARIQFTPHLLPVDRGILATCYAQATKQTHEDEIREIYTNFYQFEPFVRMRDQAPAIKDVRGTNYCDIFTTYDERTNNIIIVSAIDNLVKGAAGQAVQNMNLMLGINQQEGLQQIPLQP